MPRSDSQQGSGSVPVTGDREGRPYGKNDKPAEAPLWSTTSLVELRRIELRARRRITGDVIGNYTSAFRGQGLVFADTREYQPGDDIKNIHWKATARTGRVVVKSYNEERQIRVIVTLDISRSLAFGARPNSAKALEFVALIGLLTERTRDALGWCIFSDSVHVYRQPSTRRSALGRFFAGLRELPAAGTGTDLGGCMQWLVERDAKRSVIFVVSDFVAPPFDGPLRALALRHDVILVHANDPAEIDLPRAGLVEYTDPESGRAVVVDTASRRVRDYLRASVDRKQRELAEIARRSGADLITIGSSPLRALAQLMERRTRRMR